MIDDSKLPETCAILDRDDANSRVYARIPLEKLKHHSVALGGKDRIGYRSPKEYSESKKYAELLKSLQPGDAGDPKMLNPLHAQVVDGEYMVVAGNRRLCALNKLKEEGKLDSQCGIPCYVYTCDAKQACLIANADNQHRKSMTDSDLLNSIRHLSDLGCRTGDIENALAINKD